MNFDRHDRSKLGRSEAHGRFALYFWICERRGCLVHLPRQVPPRCSKRPQSEFQKAPQEEGCEVLEQLKSCCGCSGDAFGQKLLSRAVRSALDGYTICKKNEAKEKDAHVDRHDHSKVGRSEAHGRLALYSPVREQLRHLGYLPR